MDPPEPIVADPDIDFLVAEYGLEWVQDNYRGELTAIGLDPAQLFPCLIPQGVSDVSTWQISFTDISGPPRKITCGPGGVWVHQRNAGSTTLLNPDGSREATFNGVGEPSGNAEVIVFHTFTTIDFTTDPEPGSVTRLVSLGDDGFISDAVPFGDSQILTAGTEVVLYNLDGSRAWTIPSGSQGEFVLGANAWWVADNVGQLIQIPLDGSEPFAIEVPDAVLRAPVDRRAAPRLLPFAGGVWITNGDGTIQFVNQAGELGGRFDVGPASRDDGVHHLEARQLSAYEGYLLRFKGSLQHRLVGLIVGAR